MTLKELEAQGVKPNKNMWIGNGYIYCVTCKRYTHHMPYSTSNVYPADCILVCKTCKTSQEEVKK